VFLLKNLFLLLVLTVIHFAVHAQQPKASSIESYSNWKKVKDMYRKDCDTDAAKFLKGPTDKKSMIGADNHRQMELYIPANLIKTDLDSMTSSRLAQIEQLAKSKALDVFKKEAEELRTKSPQNPNTASEIANAEKKLSAMSGFQAASHANLIPDDFLKKFDYAKACHCQKNSENIAKDENTYNSLSYSDLMKLEDLNKIKCFVQSATF
jgi:hypothetical protein